VRPNVIEIVRSRADNQDSDISALDVLLMPMFLSMVIRTSEFLSATAISSPFSLLPNPASPTVWHSCPPSATGI
jgi:hypothetical protein